MSMQLFTRRIPLSLLFLPLLTACSNSQAEPKSGDQFGDWIYVCQAVSANKSKCNITQSIIAKKENKRILEINIANHDNKNDAASMSVLLPLGIYLPAGVSAAITSAKNTTGKPFPLTTVTCRQNGCIAVAKLDKPLLDSMRGGDKLAISFAVNAKDKPVALQGSLKGITDGLKAINVK